MDDTKIKEAFTRAKQDILDLKQQLDLLTQETHFLRQNLDDILYHQQFQQVFQQTDRQTDQQTQTEAQQIPFLPAQNPPNQAIPQRTPALQHTQLDTPAQKYASNALKKPFSSISSGNEGVPADRQTDRQTDQQTQNQEKIGFQTPNSLTFQHMSKRLDLQDASSMLKKPPHSQFQSNLLDISDALETLDQAKKGIRLQFKRLTKQEMEIFAAIFTLEEQGLIVDYPLLAQKCFLTESSIRDYLQKLLKKGAPIIKTKENNKKILLKIAPELKKIASLQTIQHLREL